MEQHNDTPKHQDPAKLGAAGVSPEYVEQSGANGSGEGFSPQISTPPQSSLTFPQPLGADAYCGLAGDIVRAIAPHTEADPAALFASLLVMFGNMIGRGPCFMAGDVAHATNLFVTIVGETSTGRKGTSAEGPRRLLVAADESWRSCIQSGLVSGEGLIHHVRDARTVRRKAKKGEQPDSDGKVEDLVDAGVQDKRLLLLCSEFAQVLSVVERKDNTLSAVMRDAWDRGDVQTLAKNSPERATGALVSVLAHITPEELRARLSSTEIANGFANRFMYIASRRSKLLPRGGSIPPEVVYELAPRLSEACEHARQVSETSMTEPAWALWDDRYESLTTAPIGLVGAVTGRAAPVVRRLALVYALMDQQSNVDEEHLRGAMEMWRYVDESAKWVFGDRLGEQRADRCLELLRDAGQGMTRTDLREALGHRVVAEQITDALALLERAGLACRVVVPTGGRPADRWFADAEHAAEFERKRTGFVAY